MPITVTLGIALLAKNVRLWSGNAIRNNDKRKKKFLFKSDCLLLNLRTRRLALGFFVVKKLKSAKRSKKKNHKKRRVRPMWAERSGALTAEQLTSVLPVQTNKRRVQEKKLLIKKKVEWNGTPQKLKFFFLVLWVYIVCRWEGAKHTYCRTKLGWCKMAFRFKKNFLAQWRLNGTNKLFPTTGTEWNFDLKINWLAQEKIIPNENTNR